MADLGRALARAVRGGDGDVVVETEAHRAIALGVVPRRPHRAHRGLVRIAHHALDRVDRRAGGEQRDFVRFRRRVRVRIQLRGLARPFRDPPQVVGAVDARQLLARRLARSDDLEAALAPARRDGVHDLGPFGPFGMPGRRLVLGEAVGVNQDDGHSNCRL
jgi:hypothetical protein